MSQADRLNRLLGSWPAVPKAQFKEWLNNLPQADRVREQDIAIKNIIRILTHLQG
jgi:hypothetical protein